MATTSTQASRRVVPAPDQEEDQHDREYQRCRENGPERVGTPLRVAVLGVHATAIPAPGPETLCILEEGTCLYPEAAVTWYGWVPFATRNVAVASVKVSLTHPNATRPDVPVGRPALVNSTAQGTAVTVPAIGGRSTCPKGSTTFRAMALIDGDQPPSWCPSRERVVRTAATAHPGTGPLPVPPENPGSLRGHRSYLSSDPRVSIESGLCGGGRRVTGGFRPRVVASVTTHQSDRRGEERASRFRRPIAPCHDLGVGRLRRCSGSRGLRCHRLLGDPRPLGHGLCSHGLRLLVCFRKMLPERGGHGGPRAGGRIECLNGRRSRRGFFAPHGHLVRWSRPVRDTERGRAEQPTARSGRPSAGPGSGSGRPDQGFQKTNGRPPGVVRAAPREAPATLVTRRNGGPRDAA
jgi:hypothetical protein